jgi:hypothetical protein
MKNEAKNLMIENALNYAGPKLERCAQLVIDDDCMIDGDLFAAIAASVSAMHMAANLIHELTGGAVPLPDDIDEAPAEKPKRVRKPRRPIDTTQTTAEAAVSHAEGGAE